MLLLLIPLNQIRTNGNPESNVFFVLGMILVNFPWCLLVGLAVGLIGWTTGWSMPWHGAEGVVVVSVTWLAYVALGYLQWFVLCPWLIRWLRGMVSFRFDKPPGNKH